jgi:aryl-alcohol dehydrogenase-like predicted oxidoreductase
VDVTQVCLGTMTWGVQNGEAEAHAQLDYAIKERGVNFIDTAEMYPVPSSADGWKPGVTEEFIGSWLTKNPDLRKDLIIATKISGFNPQSETGGNRFTPRRPKHDCRLDKESIFSGCDASLRRLKTDYIDLYQLHWPDRYVPAFGNQVYDQKNERQNDVPIKETVAALGKLIGKYFPFTTFRRLMIDHTRLTLSFLSPSERKNQTLRPVKRNHVRGVRVRALCG